MLRIPIFSTFIDVLEKFRVGVTVANIASTLLSLKCSAASKLCRYQSVPSNPTVLF